MDSRWLGFALLRLWVDDRWLLYCLCYSAYFYLCLASSVCLFSVCCHCVCVCLYGVIVVLTMEESESRGFFFFFCLYVWEWLLCVWKSDSRFGSLIVFSCIQPKSNTVFLDWIRSHQIICPHKCSIDVINYFSKGEQCHMLLNMETTHKVKDEFKSFAPYGVIRFSKGRIW